MNVSWLLDTPQEGCSTNKMSHQIFFACEKVNRTMASGFEGTPYFRRYGREFVSKPAISVSVKKRGGGGYRRTTPSDDSPLPGNFHCTGETVA